MRQGGAGIRLPRQLDESKRCDVSSSPAWGWFRRLAAVVETTWERLLSPGRMPRSVSRVLMFRTFPVRSLARSRTATASNGTYNPSDWMEPKEQRKVDDFITYAMAAATQALRRMRAGSRPPMKMRSVPACSSSGIGGLQGIEKTSLLFAEKGPRRVSPFFIPGRLINLASGYVSIEHGLKGPNDSVVTACSTGAHAIGDASRLVGLADADVMVAAAAESRCAGWRLPASLPAVPLDEFQ